MNPGRPNAPARPPRIQGVKIFSAGINGSRPVLGERVTSWLVQHPEIAVADIVVTQSSDFFTHCLTICVFYGARAVTPPPDDRASPGRKGRAA